jgi:hypothetical protein
MLSARASQLCPFSSFGIRSTLSPLSWPLVHFSGLHLMDMDLLFLTEEHHRIGLILFEIQLWGAGLVFYVIVFSTGEIFLAMLGSFSIEYLL